MSDTGEISQFLTKLNETSGKYEISKIILKPGNVTFNCDGCGMSPSDGSEGGWNPLGSYTNLPLTPGDIGNWNFPDPSSMFPQNPGSIPTIPNQNFNPQDPSSWPGNTQLTQLPQICVPAGFSTLFYSGSGDSGGCDPGYVPLNSGPSVSSTGSTTSTTSECNKIGQLETQISTLYDQWYDLWTQQQNLEKSKQPKEAEQLKLEQEISEINVQIANIERIKNRSDEQNIELAQLKQKQHSLDISIRDIKSQIRDIEFSYDAKWHALNTKMYNISLEKSKLENELELLKAKCTGSP